MKCLLIFVLLPVSCFAQKVKYFNHYNYKKFSHHQFLDTINLYKIKNIDYINYIIKDSAADINCNNSITLHLKKVSLPIKVYQRSSRIYIPYGVESTSILEIPFCYFDDKNNVPPQKDLIKYRQWIGFVDLLISYKKKQKIITLNILIEKTPQPVEIIESK